MIFDQIWREEWKRESAASSYDKDISKVVKVQKRRRLAKKAIRLQNSQT